MVLGQIFRSLSGGDHGKAAGARPVDQLADQRRLVAVGEGVDHAGAARLPREKRAGEHVGLDVHHDDVLAVGDGAARVGDAGGGVAGGLDDDFEVRCG
jgi:hypothetical protein